MAVEPMEEERPGRVILTFARSWQALVAARSLGRRDVEVICGDVYPLTPTSFSRHTVGQFRYPDPVTRPAEFLDTLEETIARFRPEEPSTPYVLLPIHRETFLIARHRSRFEPDILVPVPQADDIDLVHDKGRLAELAKRRRIPCPRTWAPESAKELEELATEIDLPAFVKLRQGAAGVGIERVSTRPEMIEAFSHLSEQQGLQAPDLPIVQQAVPGEDYCVTTLFDRGQLVAAMTYRSLRCFPSGTGASVLRETVDAPELERLAERLLGPLGWHGVAEIDVRWEGPPDGQMWLIEVNPRFWGGLIQAVESGWDYPWLLYRLAVDDEVDPPDHGRLDIRTETPILGLLATLEDMASSDTGLELLRDAWVRARHELSRGSLRAAIMHTLRAAREHFDLSDRLREVRRLLELHRGNVYDVLSSDDPLPALGILFPLAVFLRHGRVNMELLSGEGAGDSPLD